ncbi:putative fatty-acid--CoA ligase FadD10 [Lobulomyces angularis]|nr:putative fatty-acid--CoA ligase FadD10 [Lobulomyces angularis]
MSQFFKIYEDFVGLQPNSVATPKNLFSRESLNQSLLMEANHLQLKRRNSIFQCEELKKLDLITLFQPSKRIELSVQEECQKLGDSFTFTHRSATSINAFQKTPKCLKNIETLSTEEYINFLKENFVKDASRISSPFRIAHQSGPLPFYIKHLATLLTTLNQNMMSVYGSPTLSIIEKETIAEIHKDFFGGNYERSINECYGISCSGGTVANITGLWVARNRALQCDNSGIEQNGLYSVMIKNGYAGVAIITSCMNHYSIKKAAGIMGLGESSVIEIDTDAEFKIRTDLVEEKVKELKSKNILVVAIVGIAGTTEVGSIDNMIELGRIARDNNIHFHVDACWGAPFIYSSKFKDLFLGIENADTIAVDGHKYFHTPYGLGILLYKQGSYSNFIQKSARYAIRDANDLGKYTLEGSRPGNILYLHANLSLMGKKGFAESVEAGSKSAFTFSKTLKLAGRSVQIFNRPQTNILCYRFIPSFLQRKNLIFSNEEESLLDYFNINIENIQTKTGKCFVSRTKLKVGKKVHHVLRVVFMNVMSTKDDLNFVFEEQLKISFILEKKFDNEIAFTSKYPDFILPEKDTVSFIFDDFSEKEKTLVALVDDSTGQKITYGNLISNIDSFAERLSCFDKWEVVGVYSPNNVEYPIAVYGILRAGLTVTTINPEYRLNELIYQLKDSNAKFLIVHRSLVCIALEAFIKLNISEKNIIVFGEKKCQKLKYFSEYIKCKPSANINKRRTFSVKELYNRPAFLCYSSGTTGLPKGVKTSHLNMISNLIMENTVEKSDCRPGDMFIGIIPFYHLGGLGEVLPIAFMNRISVAVTENYDFNSFLKALSKWKCTTAHIVPPIALLLAKSPETKNHDLTHLRLIVTGGAPLGAETSQAVKEKLGIPIKQAYGMTELSPISLITVSTNIVEGSVGVLVPNQIAKILSPEGQSLGFNQEGELWLKGTNVMIGYLNNDVATKNTIKNGWLRTGDIAKVDEDGNFYIVDRIKEIIKYLALQIAPSELEDILLTHPKVIDAAVIPIKDEKAGEVPLAFVVLKRGVTAIEGEIKEFVSERVADYKCLRGKKRINYK